MICWVFEQNLSSLNDIDSSHKTLELELSAQIPSFNDIVLADQSEWVDSLKTRMVETSVEQTQTLSWHAFKNLGSKFTTAAFKNNLGFELVSQGCKLFSEIRVRLIKNVFSFIFFFEHLNLFISSHDVNQRNVLLLAKSNDHLT